MTPMSLWLVRLLGFWNGGPSEQWAPSLHCRTNSCFQSECYSCITVPYINFLWWHSGFSWYPHDVYCVWELQSQAACSWMNKHRRRLRSAQIYMKCWYPTCWEACRKLSHNNLSPNSNLYRYIQGWFTHSQTDKQVHIIKGEKKRRTTPGKMNRVYTCWWIDPCFIRCNSLWWSVMEKKKKKTEEDDKGFVYGSNTHFIRASCKKTETW